MPIFRISTLTLFALFFSACVTINVYFPAAAAQEAADRIVNQVYGTDSKPDSKTPEKPTDEKPAGTEQKSWVPPASQWASNLVNFMVSPAYAGADLDISSPAISALTSDMTKRHQKLLPHYESGAIGLTNDALITLRDPNKVPLKSRTQVKQLVADENQDRLELYREIATANGHPEWEADIRATFATRWISRASAGWWYQDKKGGWQQR